MKTTSKIAIGIGLLLVTVVCFGFGMWRYRISRDAVSVAQAVIIRDRSDSQLSGCDGVAGIARELLDTVPFGDGSKIALMVTGDTSTAGEPQLMTSLDVPVSKRVSEGRSIFIQQQHALTTKLRDSCRSAGQTTQSPIYLGVRRAIEHMRAQGCNGRNTCVVYVQSDLEELSEKSIRDSVAHPARSQQTSLPTLIQNQGIDVKICGLSETAGIAEIAGKRKVLTPQRDAKRADLLTSVWQKLFTDPTRVTFNSHCPRTNE